MPAKEYRISEVARQLGRVPHTLRMWEFHNLLPKELMPSRDSKNWRTWNESQIEGLRKWMVDQDRRPGKGLRSGGGP